jgi:hypothetical protein
MLINQAWAGEAIHFLWNDPAAEALAALPAERRQYYAAAVRALRLDSAVSVETARALADASFPRLQKLRIKAANVLCNAFVGRCPRLDTPIAADGISADSRSAVLELLQSNAHTLRHVCIGYPLPAGASVVQLSRLTQLEDLTLSAPMPPSLVRVAVAARDWSAFARLRGLDINALSPAAFLLLECVDSALLVRLTVTLRDERPIADLARLAEFPNLCALTVHLPNVTHLPKEHMSPLARLAQLQTLIVDAVAAPSMRDARRPAQTDMADADVVQLVAHMDRLSVFHLDVGAPKLTVAALRGMGRRCPLLTSVRLTGVYALDALGTATGAGPLFPELEFLCMDGVRPASAASAAAAAAAGADNHISGSDSPCARLITTRRSCIVWLLPARTQ